MTGPEQHYFEDVVVGHTVETPALTLTEAHVSLYLGLTREDTGGPAVPEILPLCLSIGLGWRIAQPPLAVQAFVALEWRLVQPLSVGDTIRVRSRTRSKRSMRDGGIVIVERDVLNQRDEVAQKGVFTFTVAKRPQS